MVCIGRKPDLSLAISQQTFSQLFDDMKADPSVKYMVCENYDGFHEFHSGGFRLTRFIGTAFYALVWTFDPPSMSTAALFLDRRLQHESFTPFVAVLQEFGSYIHTPSLLCFVSCYFLLHTFDRQTNGFELQTLQRIEKSTGFAPHPSRWVGMDEPSFFAKLNIDDLTRSLQAVSEVSINITNRIRHQRNSSVLLATVREEYQTDKCHGISDHALGPYRHTLQSLQEAIPSVERHMSAYVEYLKYLKERSERLSSVLFALLTHEDADASIGLAAATKRDSSSMKTVAIMTMAFLPATFFAALFAVPSLHWDQSVVVQDTFWVYWAFTLPTTLAVFVIWLLITGRKQIQKQTLHLYTSAKRVLI
ncbi:hypothetical protein B0T24DRAFT_533967 [Lasiosphaeria ovina]|uniref:Uncharacterized protein n=1 Tax=Lasiosphaeria ovina TaxID=92902 RepID=A0AAE0N1I3_9PEZI|nr:hypothetical protein B0T24DRAFT_533967 [Lasiosphaeria ovina]